MNTKKKSIRAIARELNISAMAALILPDTTDLLFRIPDKKLCHCAIVVAAGDDLWNITGESGGDLIMKMTGKNPFDQRFCTQKIKHFQRRFIGSLLFSAGRRIRNQVFIRYAAEISTWLLSDLPGKIM